MRSVERILALTSRGGGPDHSGLAPENLTTLPHFSISSATSFPKSAGEPGITVPPKSASRALSLESAKPALIRSRLECSWARQYLAARLPRSRARSRPRSGRPACLRAGCHRLAIQINSERPKRRWVHRRPQLGDHVSLSRWRMNPLPHCGNCQLSNR